MTLIIRQGDCRNVLATLPAQSVHCCVTSPPYFGLRDYGVAGQIGLEATPDAYVAELVAVFAAVRRVLRESGAAVGVPEEYADMARGGGDQGLSAFRGDGKIGRNKRSVWEVATNPYSEAHFATFPPDLIEPCIKAGCPKGGCVLDPFGGAGTTGMVADRLGRNALLIELNPAYAGMAENRLRDDAGMFAEVDCDAPKCVVK